MVKYFDVPHHWTCKIAPRLDDPAVVKVLVRDFNRFTFGRWRKRFTAGMVPHDFESCDWWVEHRGPMPRYWNDVKHAACHWLVHYK